MIDAVIAGLLGGTLGPRLGGMFSRVGYARATLYGFILGLMVTFLIHFFAFFWYEVNVIDRYIDSVKNGEIVDTILAIFGLSAFFSFIFVGLRFLGEKPTWEQAQLEFDHEGYRRSESEEGRVVTFERGRNKFIARLERRSNPKQIEWYTDGERKGQVYLAPRWMR